MTQNSQIEIMIQESVIVIKKSNIRVNVRFCYIGTGSLAAEVAAVQTPRLTCTVSIAPTLRAFTDYCF